MNPIDLLLTRQSTPLLTEPAPNEEDLTKILQAGMRVPDHGGLQPWYFNVIAKKGLQKLSDILVHASDVQNASLAKVAKMPFRAPMIIVISTQYVSHEKVPKQEQLITAGCCAHAMQMAAVALQYGAIWRTGALAYNDKVKKALNIKEDDDIVGFLYVGTPCKVSALKPTKSFENKVSYWL